MSRNQKLYNDLKALTKITDCYYKGAYYIEVRKSLNSTVIVKFLGLAVHSIKTVIK
jgi:hypothetical protein